jgi:hypothetical protein
MKFKGHITKLQASVHVSGDAPRRVTLELHEEEPAAFASLNFLVGKAVSVDIQEEEKGPFE